MNRYRFLLCAAHTLFVTVTVVMIVPCQTHAQTGTVTKPVEFRTKKIAPGIFNLLGNDLTIAVSDAGALTAVAGTPPASVENGNTVDGGKSTLHGSVSLYGIFNGRTGSSTDDIRTQLLMANESAKQAGVDSSQLAQQINRDATEHLSAGTGAAVDGSIANINQNLVTPDVAAGGGYYSVITDKDQWKFGKQYRGYSYGSPLDVLPAPGLKAAINRDLNDGMPMAHAQAEEYLRRIGSRATVEDSKEFGEAYQVWHDKIEGRIDSALERGDTWAGTAAAEWGKFHQKGDVNLGEEKQKTAEDYFPGTYESWLNKYDPDAVSVNFYETSDAAGTNQSQFAERETGVPFGGTPGIILGANQEMCWGATVNPLDVSDVYHEVLTADPFIGSQTSQSVPTLLVPRRNTGPLTNSLPNFDVGSQNWSYVDVNGNIAYFTSAESPIREDLQTVFDPDGLPPFLIRDGTNAASYNWLSVLNPPSKRSSAYKVLPFAEMPQVQQPPSEYIISANNDPVGTTVDNIGQAKINGGFSYENVFLIDGFDANDNSVGTSNSLFIEDAIGDAIEETQVLTSGTIAEYGRFTGGVVNAITKSGGNEFSGSLRVDLANDDWSFRTPLANEPSSTPSDIDGDGIPNDKDRDRDGDGIVNELDAFPNDPSNGKGFVRLDNPPNTPLSGSPPGTLQDPEEITFGVTNRLGSKGLVRADVVMREWENFYARREDISAQNPSEQKKVSGTICPGTPAATEKVSGTFSGDQNKSIKDVDGNNASSPIIPSNNFAARFTVDSRPEVGVWGAGTAWIDINGNETLDERNVDFVNRDIIYAFGNGSTNIQNRALISDDFFAGNFTANAEGTPDGFDKLGVYGSVGTSLAGPWRWLIDTNNDGVPNVNLANPAAIDGIPVAGNFSGNPNNSDEVGLFGGTSFLLDTTQTFAVNNQIVRPSRGLPVVGDFDNDGLDDLGTWNDDQFQFDLANDGFGDLEAVINFGFIGIRERPVAADINQDGIDDLGLWGPDSNPGSSDFFNFKFGATGDEFVIPSDYDGDGNADLADLTVFRRTPAVKGNQQIQTFVWEQEKVSGTPAATEKVPDTFSGPGLVSNVITKSGGNQFSGSVNYYLQSDSFIEDTAQSASTDFGTFDAAATLGGPIWKDKAWFFANYRQAPPPQDSLPGTPAGTLGITPRLGQRGLVRADLVFREWEDFYAQRDDIDTDDSNFVCDDYDENTPLRSEKTATGFRGVEGNGSTGAVSAELKEPFANGGAGRRDGAFQSELQQAGLTNAILERFQGAKTSDDPVVVAVIDTGIDLSHPELWGQLWRNAGEIPFNRIDDDQNGYVDDVYGWNTQANRSNIWDDNGHGTHIAGIIAARWDGRGMAGVAPGCRLMIVKAANGEGKTDSVRIALGIRYAVNNGAKIIHISAETNPITELDQHMIDWARSKGVLVVAAAGSNSRDTADISPAGLDGVLTVGACDENDKRAEFSGWGQNVDLVAPGMNILSLRAHGSDFMHKMAGELLSIAPEARVVDERWYRADGTSFAAPFVTGVAAALWASNPELTAEQIKNKLIMSCDDIEQPGWDILSGAGRLNAAKALEASPDHMLHTRIDGAEIAGGDRERFLKISGRGIGTHFQQRWLQIAFGNSPSREAWQTIEFSRESVADGTLGMILGTRFNRLGTWSIRSIVQDTKGAVRESRTTVEIE